MTTPFRKIPCAKAIFLVWAVMLSGCAGGNIYPKLHQSLSRGDCAGAGALIETNQKLYGVNAQLLYLLDGAMVALQCREYDRMQERLHAAEDLAEKLWTESISRHAAAMVTSDYVLKYSGEDYERVMIHIVSAIGYLQLGQLDEALVEVRRLNTLLNTYVDQYQEEQLYKADAFGRYLSGLLREADGDVDGAYIDYAKAVEAYQGQADIYPFGIPQYLLTDFFKAAEKADRMADAHNLVPDAPEKSTGRNSIDHSSADDSGKIVLIVFAGEGPKKVQHTVVVPTPRGPISVAVPQVEVLDNECVYGKLLLTNGPEQVGAELQRVSNINRIALKSLEQKKGRIIAKTIARTVSKQVVIEGLASTQSRRDRGAVTAILNIVNTLALEKADIRCWRMLPGTIYLARVYLAPGTYAGQLRWCNDRTIALEPVAVDAGQTRFLFADARY